LKPESLSVKLQTGDRIRVGGGYDMDPAWPCGRESCCATVKAFIPGQNESPAVVVELDEAVTFEGVRGKYLVLELRYSGAEWKDTETVHVELCDFEPQAKAWRYRRQGKWVESHATYRKL
jgi:hypothetical protein